VILSDREILAAMERGTIKIEPFKLGALGGNSYDVHLGPVLRVHAADPDHGYVLLDAKQDNPVVDVRIPEDGLVLHPGVLYLASTVEYTETHEHVPYLDGKSSIGRLGVAIHATAGRGDVGFCNHWTMEIYVVEPVKVYAGMPIGQLTYHTVCGQVERRYGTKLGTSYGHLPRDPLPQPSRLWTKLR
jgi:dCTP deaminase